MVGLLYLPRLFVYHNEARVPSQMDKTFLLMEGRLLKFIMYPSLIASYLFGIILIYINLHLLEEGYFLLKLSFVLCITVFHLYLSILYKDFKKGYRLKETKFYRIINEIPTILMIIIILLIFLKPDFS